MKIMIGTRTLEEHGEYMGKKIEQEKKDRAEGATRLIEANKKIQAERAQSKKDK